MNWIWSVVFLLLYANWFSSYAIIYLLAYNKQCNLFMHSIRSMICKSERWRNTQKKVRNTHPLPTWAESVLCRKENKFKHTHTALVCSHIVKHTCGHKYAFVRARHCGQCDVGGWLVFYTFLVVVVHRYIWRLPGNITFAGAQIRAEFGRNISNITCNLFLGHKLLNLHTDSRERKLIKFSRQNIPPKVHKSIHEYV